MKKKGTLFLCVALLFTFSSAFAETITLNADNDTYIDKLYPDDNFGQKWNLLTSGSVTKPANGLLSFDFTGVSDSAIITKATLTLLVHGNHSTTKHVINPLTTSWEETFATWNLAGSGRSWTTPGGDYDTSSFLEALLPSSAPGWLVTDITSLVCNQQGGVIDAVADNGLIVRADAGYNKILSSEFSTYAKALTCHSCHGTYDTSRDTGKSTNCAQCHSQGDIRLSGEPTLVLEYEPMLFEFVQVSDTHIGKSPQQLTNLTDTIAQINDGINPAFVLFTGDLTDSGSEEQYTAFKSAVAGLSMPYYCVPGDNDIVDGEGNLDRYREQMGNDYYAFDYKGFNFIGINNNIYLSLDDSQRAWLENEFEEGKPEIVFAHQPLLDLDNSSVPYTDAAQLLSLFDSYKVVLYMNGHWHEAAEHTRNNTHFIWCDNLSYAHLGDTYNLYRVYADRILLYNVDLRDGSQTLAGSFPLAQSPTLISLASFQAIPSHNRVIIQWETAAEIDNAGFNIYRAGPDGEYKKINDAIIPAQGSPTTGAVYQFIDESARNRQTYSYKLEDIDANGTHAMHGPVSATPGLIYLFR